MKLCPTGDRASYSIRSFALASATVCHRMFSGESAPPRLRGTTWSATYPGHAPVVFPVAGQGMLALEIAAGGGIAFDLAVCVALAGGAARRSGPDGAPGCAGSAGVAGGAIAGLGAGGA